MRSPCYGSKVARRLMTGRWGLVKDAHGINPRFTQGGGGFIAGPWIRPGATETRQRRRIDNASDVLSLHAADTLHAQDGVALQSLVQPAPSSRLGYLRERSGVSPSQCHLSGPACENT